MSASINYVNQAVFLIIQTVIAIYHAHQFDNNKKINHFVWGTISVLIIGMFFWVSMFNWWLAASLVMLRFVWFSPILNVLRHPAKSFFYINPKGDSWIDRKIYPIYRPLWFCCLIIFIVLQFFL